MLPGYFSRSSSNLFIILLVACQTLELSVALNARISLHVEGNGFHRNLFYRVDLDGYNQDSCYVALHLELPSTIYVNVDELADLGRLGVSTACSVGETDVELFAEKAQPQNVTVCALLLNAGSILQLPVHQRYQYAREDGGYANVSLPRPRLLLGCTERVKGHRISRMNLCSPCTELVAKWREIPYKMDGGDVTWQVPVGDRSLLTLIGYSTLLVTVVGALYVSRTMMTAKVQEPKGVRKSD